MKRETPKMRTNFNSISKIALVSGNKINELKLIYFSVLKCDSKTF